MARIEAASVIARRGDRFLLVRRRRGTARGQYAFPGGRCEPGESAADAARRELFEETGLSAGRLGLFRTIELDAGDRVYELHVFSADGVEGRLEAGDDADEARWFSLAEMASLPITASTLEIASELAASHCGEGGEPVNEASGT